jgi:hypothetical protein
MEAFLPQKIKAKLHKANEDPDPTNEYPEAEPTQPMQLFRRIKSMKRSSSKIELVSSNEGLGFRVLGFWGEGFGFRV